MLEPQQIVLLLGSVLALIGVLAGVSATRGKTSTDAKTALDARIDARVSKNLEEAWKEIDGQKKQILELEKAAKEQEAKITEQAEIIESMRRSDERKTAAFVRIFRAIEAQWPTPGGPDINPLDMAEVEDTLPVGWIRRRDVRAAREQAQPP